LKQTQVSPLPIHAGEPHVTLSVYNQSGDFPIQPFLLLVEKKNQKDVNVIFFISQVVA